MSSIALMNAAILYGPAISSVPQKVSARGSMMMGEMNCPRYKAAESKGITVVAEFLPPLMDAIVIKYGTPTPLASPMNAEPASTIDRLSA